VSRTTDPDVLLLQAAADKTRLGMLRQLSIGGPVCACDLTGGANVSQPTVSHHLKVLREAGWISGERRGTWIWYSLRPEAVARFRQLAAVIDPTSMDASGPGRQPRRLPVIDIPQVNPGS
jgi:ArsR family transcriptional regulator, arsenate/arsenite/antimonite-responsive transcriptional repressor